MYHGYVSGIISLQVIRDGTIPRTVCTVFFRASTCCGAGTILYEVVVLFPSIETLFFVWPVLLPLAIFEGGERLII